MSKDLLNLGEAEKVLQLYVDEENACLRHNKAGYELAINTLYTQERNNYFRFTLTTKEYLQTGNDGFQLIGGAQFIVRRDSGEIHLIGTLSTLEDYEQEQNHRILEQN